MCSANIRHFFSPSRDLQVTGMTNVWHLFVETFQSAIFSGRDVSGTKETLRQRYKMWLLRAILQRVVYRR